MCQCRVRQLADAEAIRRGYNPDNPERPESFGVQDYVNQRTGEVSRVPVGIDPGWNTNPGATRQQAAADLLVGKIDAMSEEMRRIAVEDLAGSWLFKRIQSGEIPFDPTSRDPANVARGQIMAPIAALPPALAQAIGAQSLTLRLSVADAAKQIQKGRNSYLEAASYQIVQKLLDAGEVVQQSPTEFIVQGQVDGKYWFMAIRRAGAAANEIYLKSFRRMRPDEMATARKRGEVIRAGAEE
jgi:multidrug efflux pump subunit AcrA (membrane-fusion protein)